VHVVPLAIVATSLLGTQHTHMLGFSLLMAGAVITLPATCTVLKLVSTTPTSEAAGASICSWECDACLPGIVCFWAVNTRGSANCRLLRKAPTMEAMQPGCNTMMLLSMQMTAAA